MTGDGGKCYNGIVSWIGERKTMIVDNINEIPRHYNEYEDEFFCNEILPTLESLVGMITSSNVLEINRQIEDICSGVWRRHRLCIASNRACREVGMDPGTDDEYVLVNRECYLRMVMLDCGESMKLCSKVTTPTLPKSVLKHYNIVRL